MGGHHVATTVRRRMRHHLAQVNIARMRAPLDDPIMAGFTDNLERINALGASSPGFVWIMSEGEEHGGNTDIAFFGDEQLISNITVWADLESLLDFTLRSEHVDFLRRRREWFVPIEEEHLALWWVPVGHEPSVEEAEQRLLHLREHGPSAHAFTPRAIHPPPAHGQQRASVPAQEVGGGSGHP